MRGATTSAELPVYFFFMGYNSVPHNNLLEECIIEDYNIFKSFLCIYGCVHAPV